jgi:hypothetical protein
MGKDVVVFTASRKSGTTMLVKDMVRSEYIGGNATSEATTVSND